MPNCIITGEPITQANDSKAHIIPSALGGRLKPLGIMCQAGNTLAGDKIDIGMIETFQPIMSLINAARDKGQNRPIEVQDESGAKYLFNFGEPLQLCKPSFAKEPMPTGTKYQISARTIKEARTLLGRIRADYPSFDIDQAMTNAIPVQQWPEGKIKIELQLGPRTTFPSIFVGASIVAAMLGNDAHPDLKDYVARFNVDEPEMPQDTFYFIAPGLLSVQSPYAIAHSIIAYSDPSRGKVLIIIDLFNGFTFGSVVPVSLSKKIQFAHSIDVLTGTKTAVDVDWGMLDNLDWSATHSLGDESLNDHVLGVIGKLIETHLKRSSEAVSADIVERAFGSVDGKPLTREHFERLIDEIAGQVKLEWKRPHKLHRSRRADIAEFMNLGMSFLNGVSPAERIAYTQHVFKTVDELTKVP